MKQLVLICAFGLVSTSASTAWADADAEPLTLISTDVPEAGSASAAVVPGNSASVTQSWISGAPLNDPNVAVHVVEKKRRAERGGHELILYPVALQTNVKFTQHDGTALSYVYHVHENFGLQLTAQYNWYNNESGFNQELINKVREEAQAASSLLLQWGAVAGVEVTPIYGKFTFYQGTLVHFMVVVNGGAGVGSTRHELRLPEDGKPGTYGDTGYKLLGSAGAGFKLELGDRIALRLEIRDLVYTAKVDRVNGCNLDDLNALSVPVSGGRSTLAGVAVSPGCRASAFDGIDPRTGDWRGLDVPLARSLVAEQNSDALNNLSFYAGVSYTF